MGVEYKDYYKILGVGKSATKEDISKAYKKLAKKYHPDLNQDDKKAEDRFKEVNEAHEVLKDPQKRAMYDQLGPNWQNGQNFQRPPGFENANFSFNGQNFDGSGFSDFFETIFGGQGGFGGQTNFGGSSYQRGGNPFGSYDRQPQKGRDVEASLSISLDDAYHGGKKNISVNGKSLEVSIPAGIKSGAKIRLNGQGDAGFAGGPAGDLYLKMSIITSPPFSLDGDDILYELKLTPWDAALGTTARIPTLSGEVDVNIAAGTSSGKRLRLRDRGLGAAAKKGSQIVTTSIVTPTTLSDEEKELWEKLRVLAETKQQES